MGDTPFFCYSGLKMRLKSAVLWLGFLQALYMLFVVVYFLIFPDTFVRTFNCTAEYNHFTNNLLLIFLTCVSLTFILAFFLLEYSRSLLLLSLSCSLGLFYSLVNYFLQNEIPLIFYVVNVIPVSLFLVVGVILGLNELYRKFR